jgi:hypothetical protein
MHWISGPPENPALFYIDIRICLVGYPAGYRIMEIAGYLAGYPAKLNRYRNRINS